jgi:hypothetical protein
MLLGEEVKFDASHIAVVVKGESPGIFRLLLHFPMT